MTDDDKRAFVAQLYNSSGWRQKVANMSDAQVTAIYLRNQNQATQQLAPKPKDDKDDIPF